MVRRTLLGLLRVLLILLGCGLFFVFAFTIVGVVGEALVVLAFVGWPRMRRGWRRAH